MRWGLKRRIDEKRYKSIWTEGDGGGYIPLHFSFRTSEKAVIVKLKLNHFRVMVRVTLMTEITTEIIFL